MYVTPEKGVRTSQLVMLPMPTGLLRHRKGITVQFSYVTIGGMTATPDPVALSAYTIGGYDTMWCSHQTGHIRNGFSTMLHKR